MDTAELKKQLAKLKKEYKSKAKVLKKVERRASSRAHVKKRVQEEALKTAQEQLCTAREPVKVKFEYATCYESPKQAENELVESSHPPACDDINGAGYRESESTEKREVCELHHEGEDENVNKSTPISSELVDFDVDEHDTALSEEVAVDTQEQYDTDDLNRGMIIDSSQSQGYSDDHNSEAQSKSTAENTEGSTCSFESKSDKRIEKDNEYVNTKVNEEKQTGSLKKTKFRQETMLDFSFLDEENDLYSQIKSRRRKSRSVSSRNDQDLTSEHQQWQDISESSDTFSTGMSKTKKRRSSLIQEKTRPVQEILIQLSKSVDVNSQEEFSLPVEILQQGIVNSTKSDQILSAQTPRAYGSLPTNLKMSEMENTLSDIDASSQLEFQTQKSCNSSRKKGKIVRRVRGHSIKKKKCSAKEQCKEEADPASEDTDTCKPALEITDAGKVTCYPYKSCGLIKPRDPVLHAECCSAGVVTCTTSAVTLWTYQQNLWKEHFTYQPQEGEAVKWSSCIDWDSCCSVVVITRSSLSYLYYMVHSNGEKPLIIEEFPIPPKSSSLSCRLLLCPVYPHYIALSHPFSTRRSHTDISSVHLRTTSTTSLGSVPGRLLSLTAVHGVTGMVVGITNASLYIWNVSSGMLLREIMCSYRLVQCDHAMTEQGLLYVAVLTEDLQSRGGGGLLVINPATGSHTLASNIDSQALGQNRKKRWQHLSWPGGSFICTATGTEGAIFSAYTGQFIAKTSTMQRLVSIHAHTKCLALATKNAVHVYQSVETVRNQE